MREERDTWPPRVGQSVRITPSGELGEVVELLPGGRVAVRRTLYAGDFSPGAAEYPEAGDVREEWALDDLRPEHPDRAPEWRETVE